MELSIYHWLIIAAFIGVVIWAFGRKRKARFEKDARIPFEEDTECASATHETPRVGAA